MSQEILITKEENEILTMLAHGYSRKTISSKLNISYRKCVSNVQKLCKKFNAINATNCIRLAIHAGYLK